MAGSSIAQEAAATDHEISNQLVPVLIWSPETMDDPVGPLLRGRDELKHPFLIIDLCPIYAGGEDSERQISPTSPNKSENKKETQVITI